MEILFAGRDNIHIGWDIFHCVFSYI